MCPGCCSSSVFRQERRFQCWRKLQRYGMLTLRSSGHILPNTQANRERMEWLTMAICTYKGQASVAQVQGFDDLPDERLKQFIEARLRDYHKLLREAKKLLASSPTRRPTGHLKRIRRQVLDLREIDFFGNPLRTKLEILLAQADRRGLQGSHTAAYSGTARSRLRPCRAPISADCLGEIGASVGRVA
jgi:hypothetical protein